MRKLFELTFKGTDELQKLARERLELLKKNAETAVANATLYGITKMANDCPVDTGRLRASLVGEFSNLVDVEMKRGEITEGKKQSATKIDFRNMEGRIGTNVEYALFVEYGVAGRAAGRTGRSGATLYSGGFKGRGYFRSNIPLIKQFFNQVMREAIEATREGRLLREGN